MLPARAGPPPFWREIPPALPASARFSETWPLPAGAEMSDKDADRRDGPAPSKRIAGPPDGRTALRPTASKLIAGATASLGSANSAAAVGFDGVPTSERLAAAFLETLSGRIL